MTRVSPEQPARRPAGPSHRRAAERELELSRSWSLRDAGESAQRWSALARSAALVRATLSDQPAPRSPAAAGRTRAGAVRGLAAAASLGLALSAWQLTGRPTQSVVADAGADQSLFSLTNQDRASNGVGPLQWHSTLGAIGESKPYSGCGFTVDGRSYDMIQRNYFAHPILNCGQYVFSMMTASGIAYRLAGENIGWSSGYSNANSSAAYINTAFMNSPDHRANILDPRYTHVGVGTDWASTWSGSGTMSNVSMFSVEFAQLSGTAPNPTPKPTPRPTPRPTPPPTFTRNEPAPAPSLPPASTAPPTPEPTPEPFESLSPSPRSGASQRLPLATGELGTPPPLEVTSTGLLTDSVESVLEGFLLD